MTTTTVHEDSLLEALLDSWDRNNTILTNLLRIIPESSMEVRAMESSPSVAQLFAHMHYVRLVFVFEDAPDFTTPHGDGVPKNEWADERDPTRLTELLNHSANAVREAVRGKIQAHRAMDIHYDHPILLLQHMLWHEGYHHGQIKLALKLAGHPLTDDEAGPLTWDIWMDKH